MKKLKVYEVGYSWSSDRKGTVLLGLTGFHRVEQATRAYLNKALWRGVTFEITSVRKTDTEIRVE